MIMRMTDGNGEFSYDSIAAEYAAGVDSAPWNALYERPAMLRMLPSVSGRAILDAGCGSGWYAEQLLTRGATVSGVDASSAMVDHARHRLSALHGVDRERWSVQVKRLDEVLPFENASFDGAISPLVLHYMRDWRPALREVHRVLRPGAWLLFSTHHPATEAQRFETRHYFETQHIIDHWEHFGRVEFFRRSLTEIFASLADASFLVETLVEPLPTAEFGEARPDAYERILRNPDFLIIRAIRRD
jgi:SAM-dependent methyltransferase